MHLSFEHSLQIGMATNKTNKIPEDILPQDDQDRIKAAATDLLEKALSHNLPPLQALAALLLAAGTASAWARFDYTQMVALLSSYYESTLLGEAERQLQETDPQIFFGKKGVGAN